MLDKKATSLGRTAAFLRSAYNGICREVAGKSDPWTLESKNRHEGETCFVFGNGPSLRNFPFDRISHYPTFGSNGIYLIFSPDYFVTISNEFYTNHISNIQNLKCERKFIGNHLEDKFPNFDGSVLTCNWNIYGEFAGIKYPVPLRFSKRADRVTYLGGSVIFVCLQIAFFLGFKRIILAGVDHKFGFPRSEASYGGRRIKVEGVDKIHFNPNYNPEGHSMHCDMVATERSFKLALNAFQKKGCEILNATPNTALNIIPKVDLDDLPL